MKKIFLVLFFIFGLGLIFSHNSFAISDLSGSYTISSNNQEFSICSSDSCSSDYKYIYFSITGQNRISGNSYFTLTSKNTRSQNRTTVFVNPASSIQVFDISSFYTDSEFSYITLFNTSSNINYFEGVEFTWTLSENFPNVGSCPEPTPPSCDDPEENSRFIQVVIDAFWKYHIAFAGCAAALIAIFVIYRIIKGLLR